MALPGQPTDPLRPLDRELERSVPDGFRVAVVGDCILTRPLSGLAEHDAGLRGALDRLRGAAVSVGNLETCIFDMRGFTGHPYSTGDWPLVAAPPVARDLATLPLHIVGRANNHSMDWGPHGMRETARLLDEAGVAHAGTGDSLSSAFAPRWVETRGARVGLVSVYSADGGDLSLALDQHGEAPGRPGVAGLRRSTTIRVPPEAMPGLRGIAERLDPDRTGPLGPWFGRPDGELPMLGVTFAEGAAFEVEHTFDEPDVKALLRSIRLGKQFADLLVLNVHIHDEGPDISTPPRCLVDLAHAAVDAGADIVACHGVHRVGAIELHHGCPVFYGLGNFAFSDLVAPLTRNLHEQARQLLPAARRDPEAATDADVTLLLDAQGFNGSRFFESVIAEVDYHGGEASVRLTPVDLRYGEPLTLSGIPRLAEPDLAADILGRLDSWSRPFGVCVTADGLARPADG
jgi:poly-gamma-glutamate capsule biosynthesis protein CapA/YwtB (metallophosphatase superfamily)